MQFHIEAAPTGSRSGACNSWRHCARASDPVSSHWNMFRPCVQCSGKITVDALIHWCMQFHNETLGACSFTLMH